MSDADRREIGGLVDLCLAGFDRTTTFDDAVIAVDALAGGIARKWGWDGIFAMVCHAAGAVVHGMAMEAGNPFRYMGYGGSALDALPSTPMEYRLSRFTTALLGGDETAARFEFDALQPDQGDAVGPTVDTVEFVMALMRNAASRQHGGTLLLDVGEGSRWPPVCDFCCGRPAQVMFRCRPFGLRMASERVSTGPMEIRMADSDSWYACRLCQPLIEADPPQWAQVLRRHKFARPDADLRGVQMLHAAFQRACVGRRAVALPERRPRTSAPPGDRQ